MYLKSFRIYNYRKYGQKDNTVYFAANINDSGLIGSTLVIGQNNAGKTSVVTALKKASGADTFAATDFNFNYLYGILNFFYKHLAEIKKIVIDSGEDTEDKRNILLSSLSPYMKFAYEFQVDITSENSDELLTNIAPIIKNEIDQHGIVQAYVKYELKEQLKFIDELYSEFCGKTFDEDSFEEFIEFLIKGDYFETNVYTNLACTEKADGFSISSLVKVDVISFDKLHTSGRLSAAFNKIYNYKVSNNPEIKKELENQVKNINKNIDEAVSINKELTERVNHAVGETLDASNASMLLKPDMTIDSLLKNVIKYVYKDGKFEIPEDQFGMGYTNLMLIIAELVDYVDDSPETLFRNTINLLVIEEPESYMHPQMQKLLIKNLNDAVAVILNEKENTVKLNCQLIITSHSANILQGKLHAEDTFNNINYISCSKDACSSIVPLNDLNIIPSSRGKVNEDTEAKDTKAQFNFLKKHVKYNSCELFFADACVVVEGYAEETILPYYIEQNGGLSKKYISIININGAYAHIYKNLFKALKIPVVIITDIDIKGNVNDNLQITSLEGKETTNSTLQDFGFSVGTDFQKQEDNLFVVTQDKIGEYYPMSFEEAVILTNFKNPTLCKTLSETLPEIYKKHSSDIAGNSHLFQNKLGSNNKKGMFSINLLYNLINPPEDAEILQLPEYIQKALDHISTALNPTLKAEVEPDE